MSKLQLSLKELFVYGETVCIMAELKSSTTTNGEPFATTLGTSMTLTWFANSLVSQGWLALPTLWPTTAKGLALFGWMTWPAQAVNLISTIANIVDGARMIAPTLKILVWFVDTAHLPFGWQVVVTTMAALKSTTTGNGAQCAMISGISMMPM